MNMLALRSDLRSDDTDWIMTDASPEELSSSWIEPVPYAVAVWSIAKTLNTSPSSHVEPQQVRSRKSNCPPSSPVCEQVGAQQVHQVRGT